MDTARFLAELDMIEKQYGDLLWALLNSVEFRTNH